ncbi:MAG: Zn-ribbon domain-containing OB-fold protein [Actinomycetota bacterium]
MPEAPAPAVDGWFTTDAEPALIGVRCPACGSYAFPPEVFACPNPRCEAGELERVPLSRTGRVWSFSVNHYAAPPPALSPEPFEPYAVAAVELAEERIVILGRVADGIAFDALKVGLEMEIVVEPIIPRADELVWKWKPVSA